MIVRIVSVVMFIAVLAVCLDAQVLLFQALHESGQCQYWLTPEESTRMTRSLGEHRPYVP